MSVSPHVMFAGGGAAGNLFPGIAVAEHLAAAVPGVRITFAGPGGSREKHMVCSAGHHYLTIPSQPAPQSPLQALRFVTDNVAGYCAARWMLREQKVYLVIGLGGYTSTAVVRAARTRGIPVILLEQNALPSKTTRWYANEAALVCAGFDDVRPHLHVQAPVSVTGNPARPAFEQLYRHRFINQDNAQTIQITSQDRVNPKKLVVLGGAGGARSLNESMPSALKKLGDSLSDWQVIHQTGEGQLQETESRYRRCGVEALTVSFIDEIASVLFASDLVVCRSGGTTLAELALAGVPAVLVPYPRASEDHQLANAKVVASAGACRLVDESSQKGALDKALAQELSSLLVDEEKRQQMSLSMRRLAHPEASAEIASAITGVLFGKVSELMAA